MAYKWRICPSLNENSKRHLIRTKSVLNLSWEVLINISKPPHHHESLIISINILKIYKTIQKCPKINPRLIPVYSPIYWFGARRHPTARVTPSVVSNMAYTKWEPIHWSCSAFLSLEEAWDKTYKIWHLLRIIIKGYKKLRKLCKQLLINKSELFIKYNSI